MTDLTRRSLLSTGALGAAAAGLAGAAHAQDAPTEAQPLAGKVALVTGGARGIGRGAALELARAGADVAVLDIADPDVYGDVIPYPMASEQELRQTEADLREIGIRAAGIVGDVRDLASMQGAAERVVSEFGRLDIVLANAGIIINDDTVESYDPTAYELIQAVNATGVANTIKVASQHVPRPGGRIIVTTSLEGRKASGSFAYSTSKWAATGLMKNAAVNLGESGIRVNAVAPGPVLTVLALRQWGGTATEEQLQQYREDARQGALLPVGALAPEDIGRIVVLLAGPAVEYTSGMTFDATQGRTAESIG